jgi:hypothetical protein
MIPIVLNSQAVRAILDNGKWTIRWPFNPMFDNVKPLLVGYVLFVCEGWRYDKEHGFLYLADTMEDDTYNWLPPIIMPKEAIRIRLLVTSMKEERLQDITEEEAEALGYKKVVFGFTRPGSVELSAKNQFAADWDKKYKALGFAYDTNPRVLVYGVKRISEEEVDALRRK